MKSTGPLEHCPEHRSSHIPISKLSVGTFASLECPDFTPIMTLADGTAVRFAEVECTLDGEMIVKAELSKEKGQKRLIELHDLICLSHRRKFQMSE